MSTVCSTWLSHQGENTSCTNVSERLISVTDDHFRQVNRMPLMFSAGSTLVKVCLNITKDQRQSNDPSVFCRVTINGGGEWWLGVNFSSRSPACERFPLAVHNHTQISWSGDSSMTHMCPSVLIYPLEAASCFCSLWPYTGIHGHIRNRNTCKPLHSKKGEVLKLPVL